MPPNLSKAQLLNYLQCPRRFWLDQYHPEHEGDVDEMDAVLDAEEAADSAARELLVADNTVAINGRLGLRKAIEQTQAALEPGVVVQDATFEHEGISAQVDILDWSGDTHRAVSISAATEISPRHIEDCAIQSWVLRGLGLPEHSYVVGLPAGDAQSDNRLEARYELSDVSDRVNSESDRIDTIVTQARALHASLDEPAAETGPQCRNAGYACPFLDYCEDV